MPSTDPQDLNPLRPVRRIVSYAVVTDAARGVLLLPVSSADDLTGRWILPGAELRHGEHPRDCVLRALADEIGLPTAVVTPRSVISDLRELPERGISQHTLRLIYDAVLPVDLAHLGFVGREKLAGLPPMPFVAELLGLPVTNPAPLARREPATQREPASQPEPVAKPEPAHRPEPTQRPAAYAVLIDESERHDGDADRPGTGPWMLLTRLAGSKGTWTLPGGGIDHGEHPLATLQRELYEETGLPYESGPLIDLGSRHFVGRSPFGELEDFHGLRLVYAGSVPVDQVPQVIEVDGSTDLAAWIPVSELGRVGAVSAVRESYLIWQQHRAQQSDSR